MPEYSEPVADKLALFEIKQDSSQTQGVDSEGLPQENAMLSLVYSANDKSVTSTDGAAYYQAKAYLEHLSRHLGSDLDYEPVGEANYEITKPLQAKSFQHCYRQNIG